MQNCFQVSVTCLCSHKLVFVFARAKSDIHVVLGQIYPSCSITILACSLWNGRELPYLKFATAELRKANKRFSTAMVLSYFQLPNAKELRANIVKALAWCSFTLTVLQTQAVKLGTTNNSTILVPNCETFRRNTNLLPDLRCADQFQMLFQYHNRKSTYSR